MKTKNAIIVLIVLIFSLVFLAGCKPTLTPPPVNEKSCVTDSDCACGTHKSGGECFYGNKAFVNVEKQCPDYCTGIAVMFEIKCINNECAQVRIQANTTNPQPQPNCTTDSDCAPEQCCHSTSCIPTEQKKPCNLLCTNVCMPGTTDCGGSCTCENGACVAHLNNLTAEVTPPTQDCTTDADCVPEQCCHPTTCIPKDKKGVCNLLCTQECKPQTMDCGGYCACESGKCVAQLNDL